MLHSAEGSKCYEMMNTGNEIDIPIQMHYSQHLDKTKTNFLHEIYVISCLQSVNAGKPRKHRYEPCVIGIAIVALLTLK